MLSSSDGEYQYGGDNDWLICVVCKSVLEVPTHQMLCGHSFCNECFKGMEDSYENE